MEACLRREEWSEDDRLSAVEAWLSAVNEGTIQDVIGEKFTACFFGFFSDNFLKI